MEAIAFLIVYNLLFFWKAYSNPFSMARSELLSTFFPSWIHLSRGEKHDPYYWLSYKSHPVLSAYYPPHYLLARLFARASLNVSFQAILFMSILHSLFASIGFYILFSYWATPLVSLFGAIVLTYSAYNIKQQPCILYTIAWFPWLLYGITTNNLFISSLSCGMTFLAGYYPLGIQTLGISGLASLLWGWDLLWVPLGIAIGLPQLIPFIKYLPKTIRANKHDSIGRVPWWHFGSLLFPKLYRFNTDVGFWELTYYVGIVPLALLSSLSFGASRVWMLGVVSLILMLGAFSRYLPRIPARFSFTFQFALGWWATATLNGLNLPTQALLALILLASFDLYWHNSDLIPTLPYSELPNRPKLAFNTRLTRFLKGYKGRVSGLPYPLFTGHINRLKTLGYCGGMQLKLMAKFRGDTNPNGSGAHDWFKLKGDDEELDRYGIRYAYTSEKLNWKLTPIPRLYENPRLQSS